MSPMRARSAIRQAVERIRSGQSSRYSVLSSDALIVAYTLYSSDGHPMSHTLRDACKSSGLSQSAALKAVRELRKAGLVQVDEALLDPLASELKVSSELRAVLRRIEDARSE